MAKTPITTTAPTGQLAPFGLRMLPELRDRIEAAARESGRSMNAEVVARLQASFDPAADQSAIREDNRALRDQIATMQRSAEINSFVPMLLAIELRKLIDALSEEDQAQPAISAARKFANSYLHVSGHEQPIEKTTDEFVNALRAVTTAAKIRGVDITGATKGGAHKITFTVYEPQEFAETTAAPEPVKRRPATSKK